MAAEIILLNGEIYTQVTQEWAKRFNSGGTVNDMVVAMALDTSNNIIVTGWIQTTDQNANFCTVKYNPAGIFLWSAIFNRPAGSNSIDQPTALGVDIQGNIYVTGASERTGYGTNDYCTIKYNSSGVQQWVRRYNRGGIRGHISNAIAIDNLGFVYVTGASQGDNINYDIATIKYTQNGDSVWVRRYDSPYHLDDVAYSIAVDNNGDVYIVGGISYASNSTKIIALKYNSNGVQQWVNIGINGFLKKIKLDINNNVITAGIAIFGAPNGDDYLTVKYNSAGVQQWLATYNGTGTGVINDIINDLDIDIQGNVFVTGRSLILTDWDYATIKYNSSGAQQWVKTHNGMGNNYDEAKAVKVDSVGNIYVTGRASGPSPNYPNYFTTIKYNTSGVQQWLASYPGSGIDLVIDKNQNVYVAGGNSDAGFGVDYYTIKYVQFVGITPIVGNIPDKYLLYQNYPNPFNPSTIISYYLPRKNKVTLKVFDILGKEISTLVNSYQESGEYKFNFKPENISTGIYLYKLQTEDFADTKMMVYQK